MKGRKFRQWGAVCMAAVFILSDMPISAQAAGLKNSYTLGVGKKVTVTVPDRVRSVTSSNKKIVTVKKSGKKKILMTGRKAGTASVTVRYGKTKKKLKVKVGAVKLSKKTFSTSFTTGTSRKVSVQTSSGVGDTLSWVSEDDAIVSVAKKSSTVSAANVAANTLTAHNAGTTTILITSKNTGKKLQVKVTVKNAATNTATPVPPVIIATQAVPMPTTTPGNTKDPNDKGSSDVTATDTGFQTEAPDVVSGTALPDITPVLVNTPVPPALLPTDVPVTCGAIQINTNVYGAKIEISNADKSLTRTLLLGDDQNSVFVGELPFDTYKITISKEGYGIATGTAQVTADTTLLNLELEKAESVSVKSVHTTALNRIQVDFTGSLSYVDRKSFSIGDGIIVYSATITEDKTSVILGTSVMTEDKGYTLSVQDVTVENVVLPASSHMFTAKQVRYALKLSVDGDLSQVRGDGEDSVDFTTSVYDQNGYVVKDLSGVELTYSSQCGTFAKDSILSNAGTVSNTFFSEKTDVRKDSYVTVTITGAANENLRGISVTRNIVINPIDTSEFTGAYLNAVTAEYADRLLLSFDHPVNVTDYTQNCASLNDVYGYDADKMQIVVQDAGKTSSATSISDTSMGNRNIVALAPVEGNPCALWAYLDLNAGASPLTNNGRIIVRVTDKTKRYETSSVKYTNVCDIIEPYITKVESTSLRTIRVHFSEAIQSNTNAFGSVAADSAYKWTLDDIALSDNKYGYGASYAPTLSVGTFHNATGEDQRNVLTITLGKNSSGTQIYMGQGVHRLTCTKVGDWANVTSSQTNVCQQQTLDFSVTDTEEPLSATVQVDSPEQYRVTFSHAVSTSLIRKKLKLQEEKNSQWVNSNRNTITITPVLEKETDTEATTYMVEVDTDWTVAYNMSTSHKNYYNTKYRLHVPASEIRNVENGSMNPEISLPLDDEKMQSLDVISPKLERVQQYGNLIYVTMSEPVQIPGITEETVSENQKNTGIPYPVISFLSEENNKTVSGTIVSMADETDCTFCVSPTADLTAGIWRMTVAGISDDVGNSSSTLTVNDFKLQSTITANSQFKILWALAVPIGSINPLTGSENTEKERLYVKFSQNYKTYGNTTSAILSGNYTLNENSLPAGVTVTSSLSDYNSAANTKNNYLDLVVFDLPAGTLKTESSTTSNVMTVSSTIESIYGERLSNGGNLTLDRRTVSASDYYFAYQYQTISATSIDTVQKLAQYLNDTTYTTVEADYFSDAEQKGIAQTSALSIKHTGSFDLTKNSGTNRNLFKELNINTNETGTIRIKNAEFTKVTIDAPNADVVFDNVKIDNMLVEDVLDGTLKLTGNSVCVSAEITDTYNGCKLVTDTGSSIEQVIVNTIGNVTLELSTSSYVNITKPAKVTFNKQVNTITLSATAEGVDLVNAISPDSSLCTGILTDNTNNGNMNTAMSSARAALADWEAKVTVANSKSFTITAGTGVKLHFSTDPTTASFSYIGNTASYTIDDNEKFNLTVTSTCTLNNSSYTISKTYRMSGTATDLAFDAT